MRNRNFAIHHFNCYRKLVHTYLVWRKFLKICFVHVKIARIVVVIVLLLMLFLALASESWQEALLQHLGLFKDPFEHLPMQVPSQWRAAWTRVIRVMVPFRQNNNWLMYVSLCVLRIAFHLSGEKWSKYFLENKVGINMLTCWSMQYSALPLVWYHLYYYCRDFLSLSRAFSFITFSSSRRPHVDEARYHGSISRSGHRICIFLLWRTMYQWYRHVIR